MAKEKRHHLCLDWFYVSLLLYHHAIHDTNVSQHQGRASAIAEPKQGETSLSPVTKLKLYIAECKKVRGDSDQQVRKNKRGVTGVNS